MNSEELFEVSSTRTSFNERQKNLFNELDRVRVTLPQRELQENDRNEVDLDNRFQRTSFKSLRGKESIFKKPEIPLRKCLPTRKVPDFQKNPHKWTKYTLDDVKEEHMSETSNKTAALAFLKELESRKIKTDISDIGELPDKIIFQKSTLIVDNSVDNSNDIDIKPTFKSSKVVMPEYVIGQKIKKEKKNKEKRSGISSKQLMLSHLTAEDDN